MYKLKMQFNIAVPLATKPLYEIPTPAPPAEFASPHSCAVENGGSPSCKQYSCFA